MTGSHLPKCGLEHRAGVPYARAEDGSAPVAAEARRHAWVTPSGEDGFGDGGDAGRRRYVMMSDQRRREWGLPDVANGRSTTHRSSAAADGGAPTPPVTATRHPVVANEVRRRVSRFDHHDQLRVMTSASQRSTVAPGVAGVGAATRLT